MLAAPRCADVAAVMSTDVSCLQHPDLIEKRRKAFADVIKQHLRTSSSPLSDKVPGDGNGPAEHNGQ